MNPFMGTFKGGAGAGTSLPGLPPTNYSATYGGKPTVPNPTASASGAIGGNIGNLGALYGLGGGVNTFMQGQMEGAYNAAIPNYAGMAAQSSANIGSELAGELPQGVLDQILQGAAERGVATGTPGSANMNAAMVKQLLGSELDLTQMGEKNLSGAVARSPIAAPFDISKMFVSPEMEQEAAMAASLYAAAPDPSKAAQELQNLSTGDASNAYSWYGYNKPSVTHIFPGEAGFI
jgi:hypothetical protein